VSHRIALALCHDRGKDVLEVTVKDANYERVVIALDSILRKQGYEICACPQCVNAVVATALNCMTPHYYTDPKWNDCAGSPWEIIETAVLDAIRENPCHRREGF
jgi:hypothetical protein